MKRVRLASSSPHLFACVLIALFLYAGSAATTNATTPSKNSVIRVWIVGSPHTDVLPEATVPSDVRQRAESLGYQIEVESFRARGFAAIFRQARLDHHEPEILTFDNFGVIYGMQTCRGWVEGIDYDREVASSLALVHETLSSFQSRGWVMLVRSAVNFDAARALAMRPAECDSEFARFSHSQDILPALREARKQAVVSTRAYLECDRSTLSTVSDETRLLKQCHLPQSDAKVESVTACNITGNDKLAFVTLVGGFSAETRESSAVHQLRYGMDLGQRSILAVLRNNGETWRLLAITHDPLDTWANIPLTRTDSLVNLLDHSGYFALIPEPAQLLTPDGVYPASQNCERFGYFTWQTSQSTDVIGQVVEFKWGENTNWGLTRLFFVPASQNKLSTGLLMSGGASAWRVWSINKSGDVVFSEQHAYNH